MLFPVDMRAFAFLYQRPDAKQSLGNLFAFTASACSPSASVSSNQESNCYQPMVCQFFPVSENEPKLKESFDLLRSTARKAGYSWAFVCGDFPHRTKSVSWFFCAGQSRPLFARDSEKRLASSANVTREPERCWLYFPLDACCVLTIAKWHNHDDKSVGASSENYPELNYSHKVHIKHCHSLLRKLRRQSSFVALEDMGKASSQVQLSRSDASQDHERDLAQEGGVHFLSGAELEIAEALTVRFGNQCSFADLQAAEEQSPGSVVGFLHGLPQSQPQSAIHM